MSDCSLDFESDEHEFPHILMNIKGEKKQAHKAKDEYFNLDCEAIGMRRALEKIYEQKWTTWYRDHPTSRMEEMDCEHERELDKRRRNWIFITISPRKDIDRWDFDEMMENLHKRSWLNGNAFIACTEISETGHLNGHYVGKLSVNYSPSHVANMLYNGCVKHYADKGGGIDVKKVNKKDALTRLKKYTAKAEFEGDKVWGPLYKPPKESCATKSDKGTAN